MVPGGPELMQDGGGQTDLSSCSLLGAVDGLAGWAEILLFGLICNALPSILTAKMFVENITFLSFMPLVLRAYGALRFGGDP